MMNQQMDAPPYQCFSDVPCGYLSTKRSIFEIQAHRANCGTNHPTQQQYRAKAINTVQTAVSLWLQMQPNDAPQHQCCDLNLNLAQIAVHMLLSHPNTEQSQRAVDYLMANGIDQFSPSRMQQQPQQPQFQQPQQPQQPQPAAAVPAAAVPAASAVPTASAAGQAAVLSARTYDGTAGIQQP